MGVQHPKRMQAKASKTGEAGCNSQTSLSSWLARGSFAVASVAAASFIGTPSAHAVPAYARQTGQPCATCHTIWPELTPFGRQFKLMGYTSGGTRCNDGSAKSDETQVPLSVMAWPATYSSTKNNANYALGGSNFRNNDWLPDQFSLFVAGQLYCNVGTFTQMTFDRQAGPAGGFSWDNTDVRYAKTGTIDGTTIVYGITANNNPTTQDVWNTQQAWFFPYIDSSVAPFPASPGTMLGANPFSMEAGGVGGYVWINNSIYAEFSAYGNLSPRLITDLNGGFDPTAQRFVGTMPYWRFAYEKTWDKNSLMFGTIGEYADQQPGVAATATDGATPLFFAGKTDPTLDLGVDTQYQFIGERDIITLHAAYIWENKKNNAEIAGMTGSGLTLPNQSDQLNDFMVSASYTYDRTYQLQVGWFDTWGTRDAGLYGSATNPGGNGAIGTNLNGSPNSTYWKVDLAYSPFMNGGAPDVWPWFNARIGVLYTHYDKWDGSTYNIDQSGLKASGSDNIYLYTWLMF
ncbi:MAG: hypothetical protein WCD20_04425 [Rhodomicrobium sp.]